MRVRRLQVEDLRVIRTADLSFGPGLNLISGANGSGKTSLLEAVYVLSAGRSFRGGSVDHLVRHESQLARCVAEVEDPVAARVHRLGIERQNRSFEARIDGAAIDRLTDLFALCPVVCFQPDSGILLSGPSEERRRFVDWGLFHVEPGFLAGWRRYQRALKQRNAALQSRQTSTLSGWDEQLLAAAEPIHAWRRDYLAGLQAGLHRVLAALLPELGPPRLTQRAGWSLEHTTLADALRAHRETDLRLGYTGVGPHRAGWTLSFATVSRHEQLSRGQTKLAALGALLAQAEDFTARRSQSPVVCFDDLTAELDAAHQETALALVADTGMQVLLTSAEPTEALRSLALDSWFHVEQGQFSQRV